MRSLDDFLQDNWGQTTKPQGAETHMARILMDVYAKRCESKIIEDEKTCTLPTPDFEIGQNRQMRD